MKAVAVEDENVPPDAEQIVTITGDPEVFLRLIITSVTSPLADGQIVIGQPGR